MTRFSSAQRGCCAAISAVSLLLSAACGEDVLVGQGGGGAGGGGTVFLRGCVVAPRDTCAPMASTSDALLVGGSIDGLYRTDYQCFALIENQGARLSLTEAQVRVTDTDGQTLVRYDHSIAQYTVPIAGFVDAPAGGPSLGLAEVALIDLPTLFDVTNRALTTSTPQQVIAHLIVTGHTPDGTARTSDELQFPLHVCAGCTCIAPVGDQCVGGTTKPAVDCLLGQDGPADCRLLGAASACEHLDCEIDPVTMKGDPNSARCPPAGGVGNGACCQP